MSDFALEAQHAAEQWLDELEDCLGRECVGEEVEWPQGLVWPYCGCLTCQVRETLNAAWEVFVAYGVVRNPTHAADFTTGGRLPHLGEAGSRRPAEAYDSGCKSVLPPPAVPPPVRRDD